MSKQFYVYLLSNEGDNVLYVGVTNDLHRRIFEHKEKLVEGFTKKYNVTKLVHFEIFADIENAILREKQIKGGSGKKKPGLINNNNPKREDLYEKILR